MASITQLTTGNGGLIFTPPSGMHSATVFLMHGLGDSGQGLSEIAGIWGKDHPNIKFILPTADVRPVTVNNGYRMNAWYDIQSFKDRSKDPFNGLDESCEYIRQLLLQEHESTGLPYSRMMLAGFSQGGAVSLYTGLQHSVPLAGLLILSSYLPKAQSFTLGDQNKDVPVLHCHGSVDRIIAPDLAAESQELLRSKGMTQYELRMFPGVGHSISMDILRAGSEFFTRYLPHDAQCVALPLHPMHLSVKELREVIQAHGLQSKAVGLTEKQELVHLLESFYAENGINTRDK